MRFPILPFMVFASLNAFSQSPVDALKTSAQLVTEKKYDSAFLVLDKADPKNQNADIVIAKEDILLRYFVTSIAHKMFALKDLKPNEDIMDYRGKNGSFTMYAFAADSILTNLIKADTGNYKLYKARGNYYYDVFIHYNANWVESAETLFKYIESDFQKTIDHHLADNMIYYELGYIEELQKKYPKAVNYFLKSIELDGSYANAYYNLGLAYLYQDDRDNALKYVVKSIDLYTDKDYKADAARLTGEIYGELKDNKNELVYYEMSDKIEPGNYYTTKALLGIYIDTKNEKQAQTLKSFYLLDPDNPTIYNDLSALYAAQPATLIQFYLGQLTAQKNDKKAYGGLNFYLAQLYLPGDKQKAKDCLVKAKTAFSSVFEKDNPVFKAIDSLMEQAN
jgi:tetratricopeptide (TPR) repeat protein